MSGFGLVASSANALPSGDKSVRIGRAAFLVPDRAALRWQAHPERLYVRIDGEVRVYSEDGEIEIPRDIRIALAARWSSEAPFSTTIEHRGLVPPPLIEHQHDPSPDSVGARVELTT
jgi:hypothetical protein